MLLFGALRFAADRCGSKLGSRPDGGFLARPPAHTVGHEPTMATGSFLAPRLIPFGQRADHKVLTVQGGMPGKPDFPPDSTY